MLKEKREEYVQLLKKSIELIVEKLQAKVERISIFGSYSRNRLDLFTDLDILIIMESDKPFIERLGEIYSLLTLPVDVDIICYTPEEFDKIKNKSFLKKIMAEEIVVYEKGKCR